MAVIKRGILGGFQNKIGNIVGTSWKGIAIMKSLPLSVANPRTAAQVSQRERFKGASVVASTLLSAIVKPLWDRFAQGQSGYNAFVQTNLPAFINELNFDFNLFVMSKGKMSKPEITSVTADVSASMITVNWNTALVDQYAQDTDVAYIACHLEEPNLWVVAQPGFLRMDGSAQINSPYDLILGTQVRVWLAFKREDGTVVSNSTGVSATATA